MYELSFMQKIQEVEQLKKKHKEENPKHNVMMQHWWNVYY